LPAPLRLRLSRDALLSNWRWLNRQSGVAACGAAIKADGYGLGARAVMEALAQDGCRDFFVATWDEAVALGGLPSGASLCVLHGVRAEDMEFATTSSARPVLNSLNQIALWRETGRACDVMVDSGMHRLGISAADVHAGALAGLIIETLMSHLASADEDVPQNGEQLAAFHSLVGATSAKRMSLANSAGICLGPDYHFDLTRPGLALYGGVPRPETQGHIRQVAFPEAQIVQRGVLQAGDRIGYNALHQATQQEEVAILNIGYADGYFRGFSNAGTAGDGRFPVLGRVSMDLTAINVDAEPGLQEGDWVSLDFSLPEASRISGLSQYELLTSLGARFDRIWE
jgi:alanine racemase